MKNLIFIKKMNIMTVLLAIAVFTLSGCTTFGTFAGLKQNQTTTEDVRKLLGEPEKITAEKNYDIWEYTFLKPLKFKREHRLDKKLITKITFKDKVVTDYNIDVVTQPLTGKKIPVMGRNMNIPVMMHGLTPKARNFLKKFDANRDGRITLKEYFGPVRLFRRIDANHDHIIDIMELKSFSIRK